MSETLIPSPYEFDSPEGQAERNAMLRGAGIAATSLLPAWMTQVTPYRVDPQGEGHWQAPGGALGLYGSAGTLLPMAANWGLGQVGIQSNLPAFPGAEEANRQYQETRDMAFRTIPHMEPQTPDEQTIQDMAFSAGGMAVPGAGIIQGAASKLGRIPGLATHMSIPGVGRGGGAVAGATLTGGLEAYEQSEEDTTTRALGLDPAQLRMRPDLTQPDTGHQVAHPQTGAAVNVPFPTSSQAAKPVGPPLPDNIPEISISSPLYAMSGETGPTWGQVLAGAAALAVGGKVALKYGGRLFDTPWKMITGQGEQIFNAANIAEHNARVQALDAGGTAPLVTGAARGEAPLPGKAGTVGTNIAQSGWDSNRVLHELGLSTAQTPMAGERITADLGTTNGSAAMHTRIAEQMATGVNDATGHVLPKFKPLAQDYGKLTPAEAKVWEEGMQASHELNIRDVKRNGLATRKTPFTDEDIRHNYRDTPTETLIAQRNAMLADPKLSAMADHAHSVIQSNFAEGVAQGRFTPKAFTDFARTYPHFLPPVDLEGVVTRGLFDTSYSGKGWQTPPGRVIDAMTEHYGKVYEHYAENKILDRYIQQMDQYHLADPVNRPRLVTRVTNNVDPKDGRIITTYRNGEMFKHEIENSNVYRAMRNNPTQTGIYLHSMDAIRRSMQSGTTGVMASVVAQRPFAVISLLRNVAQIATDRRPGTQFGMADRGLQRATGGRLGNRVGLDPTQYIGSFDQALRGSAAVTSRNMADMLRTPNNPITKGLTQLKGDVWVEGLAQRLEAQYAKSQIADMRAKGATGGGNSGLNDPRTFNVNVSRRQAFNPLADQVPSAFHPDGIEIPFTKVALPGTKGVTQSYINLRTMMRDIHQAIADGGNAYYYKQNPHLSPQQRVIATREVLGDPSKMGSGRIAEIASHHLPYLNPSVQDIVRFTRNLRDDGLGFVAGTVTTLGMIAAGSLLSAMLGGEKHLNVLEEQMTTHERASNAVFFHDMSNAHNFTVFSLPQRWRMFYAGIQEMVAYAMGAYQLHPDEDEFHRVVHSLADMFRQHVSTSTRDATLKGVADFIDLVQVPPALQAVIEGGGGKVNAPVATMLQNYADGKGLSPEGIFTGARAPGHVPGRANSSFLSKDDAAWAQRVLSNLFGLAGHSMYDAYNTVWDRLERDPNLHGIAEAFDGLVDQAGQSWKDNAPFGNMVWGNNVRMNYHNPMADSFDGTMKKLQDMPKAADIYAEGYTRPGGVMTADRGDKFSTDPTIIHMIGMMNTYHNTITQTLQPQITDLKRQLEDIDNNTAMDKEFQRSVHNQVVGQLNELYKQGDLMVNQMNSELSYIAKKHVNAKTFDPKRGMEQFYD